MAGYSSLFKVKGEEIIYEGHTRTRWIIPSCYAQDLAYKKATCAATECSRDAPLAVQTYY